MGKAVHAGQSVEPAPAAASAGGGDASSSAGAATTEPAKSGGFLSWLKGIFGGGPVADAPDEVFKWTTEEVAVLGDFPFDTGYISTGGEYWIELKKVAAKSYEKFAYVANKLRVRNPVWIILGMACIQYTTALAKALARYYASKPAEKSAPAPDGAKETAL